MIDNLLTKTLKCYEVIDSIYESTGYKDAYKLNAFWSRENMRDMKDILYNNQTAIKAIHSVQKTWMFSVNTSEQIKSRAVNWLLKEQMQRGLDIFSMSASIAESKFSNPQNNVLVNKRNLTPDFLRTVNIANEIKKYCNPKKSRINIIELGAGCGHLARTMKFFIPNCSYTIIDIPETLCFAYMFLTLNFPDAKTLFVVDEQHLLNIKVEEFDYIFIPTKFAEGILENRFDIFINTASMGEMDNSAIRYWMDFIQNRLKIDYLFTLNRFLNTIKIDGTMNWRLEENECSVLYDTNWDILNWELEPSFTRCPYVDTVIARYVEIAAKRISAVHTNQRKNKSRKLVAEVMEEDWVRLEKDFNPVMTYRDNILVNNMLMNGTLFKLWESIRLYPDEINVGLMLKYLETLCHQQDVEFEETFYYEDLFNKLYVSKNDKNLPKIYEIIQEKRLYAKSFPALKPSYFPEIPEIPLLIKEGYRGFNIIRYKMKYHAFCQSIGPLELDKLNGKDIKQYQMRKEYYIGDSLNDVKHFIDLYAKQNKQYFCL